MILSGFWLFYSLHASTVFRSSDLLPSKCPPSTSKWTLAISGFACCSQQHTVQFNPEERDLLRESERGSDTFCINVRELMSAVFATIVWGKYWTPVSGNRQHHVRFWIDNMAAVAWNNRRASRNPFAQLLLRLLALKEVEYDFYSTAAHIAGVDNIMADAGSRVWQSSTMADTFTNLSRGWTQVAVPAKCRNLSQLWGQFCANPP
jgi:hypothetical protein